MFHDGCRSLVMSDDSDSSAYQEEQDIKRFYSCYLCFPPNTLLEALYLQTQEEQSDSSVLIGTDLDIYIRCKDCRYLYHARCLGIHLVDIIGASIWMCDDCQ